MAYWRDKRGRRGRKDRAPKEFTEKLLEVRRVTRVTTGGRRMSFRATILVGNGKGKIGVGVAKWPDVSTAVKKASREAYKTLFVVPITRANTVPYLLTTKFKSCRVRLIPASAGTGLKAGSAVRAVLELAGYENVLSKIIGSNNKLNNAIATINALATYKHKEFFSDLREKNPEAEKTNDTKKNTTTKKEIKVEEKKVEKKPEKKPVVKKETKTEEKKKETKTVAKEVPKSDK